jgi:hypothetical protein
MEPQDEEPNFKFERINGKSFSPRTFSSINKKSQLHINPNPNGQSVSRIFT